MFSSKRVLPIKSRAYTLFNELSIKCPFFDRQSRGFSLTNISQVVYGIGEKEPSFMTRQLTISAFSFYMTESISLYISTSRQSSPSTKAIYSP